MLVHLIPLGRDRLDLYAEPSLDDETALPSDAGTIRRWMHRAGEQWQEIVDAARERDAPGRLARWRDRVVRGLADSIDEQRTLWSLRGVTEATALYPDQMVEAVARARMGQMLAVSQRHHGWWLAIDLVLFVASGILFFVPGPNIVAYYLGFRAFGHLQSWRGARQGLGVVNWTLAPSAELAELALLAEQPHEVRAAQVDAIAARLGLAHLAAYFERAAA